MGRKEENVELDLSSIANGVAVEMFAAALQRILESIRDPNIPPAAKRKWVLEITVVANNRDRTEVEILVGDKLTLPGREKYKATAYPRNGRTGLVLLGPIGEQLEIGSEPAN